jgi:hypothetical protein
MTRNVSDRTCPGCSRVVPADVLVCECGHAFDDPESTDNLADTSHDAPEQELFVSYLIARVEQAREALDNVRNQLAGQPGNLGKAMEVMEAVQDLRIARAELDARLGRASPYADEIRDQPSNKFRAAQSARAQRLAVEAGADSKELPPPPYRRSPTAPAADHPADQKRRDK